MIGSAESVGSASGLIVAGFDHWKLGSALSCQPTRSATKKEKQSTEGFHQQEQGLQVVQLLVELLTPPALQIKHKVINCQEAGGDGTEAS